MFFDNLVSLGTYCYDEIWMLRILEWLGKRRGYHAILSIVFFPQVWWVLLSVNNFGLLNLLKILISQKYSCSCSSYVPIVFIPSSIQLNRLFLLLFWISSIIPVVYFQNGFEFNLKHIFFQFIWTTLIWNKMKKPKGG